MLQHETPLWHTGSPRMRCYLISLSKISIEEQNSAPTLSLYEGKKITIANVLYFFRNCLPKLAKTFS